MHTTVAFCNLLGFLLLKTIIEGAMVGLWRGTKQRLKLRESGKEILSRHTRQEEERRHALCSKTATPLSHTITGNSWSHWYTWVPQSYKPRKPINKRPGPLFLLKIKSFIPTNLQFSLVRVWTFIFLTCLQFFSRSSSSWSSWRTSRRGKVLWTPLKPSLQS